MKRQKIQLKTPFGIFALEATDKGLCRLRFPAHVHRNKKYLVRKYHEIPLRLRRACQLLSDYLKGTPVSMAGVPVDFTGYSYFERKVLRTLARVRPGEVKSYGQLASQAGFPGAARAVGAVMRKNRLPIFLPCHRVVLSNGRLGRYRGGPRWKKRLLRLEGADL